MVGEPLRRQGGQELDRGPVGAQASGDDGDESDSFDGKADKSWTEAQLALKGYALELLDTLQELAAALNDDENAHNTLLGLIGTKQPTLTTPGAGLHFLQGTSLRNLEVTGAGTLVDNNTRLTLNIPAASTSDFAT
jgi:hypothetical protein